jgi:hypothetical protein
MVVPSVGNTPVSILTPGHPNVGNTGVARGESVPPSAYGFLGEGVTDTRPLDQLIPATSAGFRPDANGLAYAPNVAGPLSYDRVDFTNVKLVIPAAVTSVSFSKCLFRTTDPSMSLNRAQGANLVQVLGASTAVSFTDCTLSGATPDPRLAAQLFLSTPNGNSSAGGVTFVRNNISGFSTGLSIGGFQRFNFDSNYVHDLVINKHADSASGYTNPGNWTHVDGLQIGATNSVGTGKVINNVLIAFSATNQIASAAIQIGQMSGPGTATIGNVVFDGNHLDGGAYIVGANTATPIAVATGLHFTNNKFGLHYAYGIDSGNTVHALATTWSGNTYAESGSAGTHSPVTVRAGQLIA